MTPSALKRTREWINVGGLTKTSKMPCYSYSLPATACVTGSLLNKFPGTVCNKCYARKGFYNMPNVRNALENRLRIVLAMSNDPTSWDRWVYSMKYLIRNAGENYFRWHDSGDLQGLFHLEAIVHVAYANPNISFWLPTKEYAILKEYLSKQEVPENLVIRVSAPSVDKHLTGGDFPHVSAVTANPAKKTCLAVGGKCGECRNCWSSEIREVVYLRH